MKRKKEEIDKFELNIRKSQEGKYIIKAIGFLFITKYAKKVFKNKEKLSVQKS